MFEQQERATLSAAFFCPQARAPNEQYLAGLHSFLSHNRHGQTLLKSVSSLRVDETWEVLAAERQNIKELSQGPVYINLLHDWATTGTSAALAKVRSGIIALPLLTILQIGQYLRYLDFHQLSHQDFLREVGHAGGGIQGYCGGLPAAIAIACARDEADVVEYTATILRVLIGIGAYAEAADEGNVEDGCTTLALRLKQEGQGEELVGRFPGTYVSAITDPRSISIVGPVETLDELHRYAQKLGLQVQKMEVTGKVHNPENNELAVELALLCQNTPSFQLPDASKLQVPVRSNKSGESLFDVDSLTEEVISTILTSRCEWFNLLSHVADDLSRTDSSAHSVVVFGLTDCVPLTPFFQRSVRITKIQAHTLIQSVNLQPSSQSPTLPDDAIAVVGASCRLPGANNLDELWTLIANKIDCSRELPADRFDLPKTFRASAQSPFTHSRKFYGNFLSNIKSFDNAFFNISPREAASMDPQQRLLLELSHEALDSSGYFTAESDDNIGCFIGASFVEYLGNTNSHAPTAYTSTGTIRAFLCGRISYHYGWSGPAEVIDTACSSSLVAINRACKAIQSGECRMALTGGINLITGANNYLDLAKAGFLSPTGQCKPFDEKADGYCRSDGAGLLVLKRLKDAVADGDMIMGVIPGVATNQGGKSCSITVPETDAQKRLYKKVLKQAGLEKHMVSYVEAHGTGTQAGDPLEVESVRSVLGGQDRGKDNMLWLGSVKGNIGHCETAAGVAGVLKVLAMLKHGKIPGQANHHRLNPKIPSLEKDGMAITKAVVDWDLPFRAALVNSYGAAGSNCALVCCEMPGARKERMMVEEKEQAQTGTAFPFLVSGTSEKNLHENARALAAFLRSPSAAGLTTAEVACTLNQKRQRHKFLASISCRTLHEAADLLEFSPPTFTAPSPLPAVLLFSGQADSKVALDRSLYDNFPIFRSYIDACSAELTKLGFSPLLPAIFEAEPIHDIATLQAGIFAVQYACAQSWIDAGLKPQAVVGHSLGELTALCVSGILCLSDAIKLIATRGRLVETKWGSDKGSMLALNCSTRELEEIQTSMPTNHSVEIACHNATSSFVAVGREGDIDAVEDLLQTVPILKAVKHQHLRTSHGFHSSLAIPILEELESVAKSLTWNKPKIPLYTCTEEPLISIDDNHSLYISNHARKAVFFHHAIRRIEKDLGPCIWMEAGIGSPIINMTRKACDRPDGHTFQAFKGQNRVTDVLGDIVSSLWKRGWFLSHWGFMPPFECRPSWLPPCKFQQTDHWLDNVDRAIETRQSLLSGQGVSTLLPPAPPQLITIKEKGLDTAEFIVDTRCDRFSQLVRGHMVRLRPLCPASLYMEATVMAMQQFFSEPSLMKGNSLVFENVRFQAPLGASPDNETMLQLARTGSTSSSWSFSLSTASHSRPAKKTSHVSGKVSLLSEKDLVLASLPRLLSGSVEKVVKEEEAETLKSARAYSLFSCVVDYAAFFRGIQKITLHDNEAVATITLPQGQPGRENSTAWELCDSVLLDVCIQVSGLLVNTSSAVSAEEVAVMVGLERAIISPKTTVSTKMTVYTNFDLTEFVGDVFVLDDNGKEVVAAFWGCRFSKVLISKLERSLDTAAGSTSSHKAKITLLEKPDTPSSSSSVSSSGVNTPPSSASPSDTGLSDDVFETLKELIAECTGANKSTIPHDAALSELGVDSLASVELVEQLSSKLNLVIDLDSLGESTVDSLARSLGHLPSNPLLPCSLPNFTSQQPSIPAAHNSIDNSLTACPNAAKLFHVLEEISGNKADDISPNATLSELGIDSLSLIELQQEVEERFSVNMTDIHGEKTIYDLFVCLGIDAPTGQSSEASLVTAATKLDDPTHRERSSLSQSPFTALQAVERSFEESAAKCGFSGYWDDAAPLQDWLTVAYILEAFSELGVDIKTISTGQSIPQVPYQTPRYDRLVSRLWEILKEHDIVSIGNNQGTLARGVRDLNQLPSSAALLHDLRLKHPNYSDEIALLALTGPRLADCLADRAKAVSLMFGNPTALQIMESYYRQSPMLATMTEQLVIFVLELIQNSQGPVRILEVGAGTGGTTKRLAEALSTTGAQVEYTFTDIAPGLVAKAKSKFRCYDWMEYSTLDLEKETPKNLAGKFDLVISTNCVHATVDREASCRRLREMLKDGGVVVLSEVTRVIDWYDVSFGLLDGWWHAETYPLQPAKWWMDVFEKVGFASVGFSTGQTLEAQTQRLLVGCDRVWETGTTSWRTLELKTLKGSHDARNHMQTLVYKEVDGVKIHADVYFPAHGPTRKDAMPIALMIHGGGHMTLSRKSIRQGQLEWLHANGFLPVSIDYRLCPEVNLIDGPMADVLSAYQWCKNELPNIAEGQGFGRADASKVVAIGWSSGGHLAMSLGWTTRATSTPPPTAVLSFYAPYDFESGELDKPRLGSIATPKTTLDELVSKLPRTPITSYHPRSSNFPAAKEEYDLGWLRCGDPRSDLVLSLFKSGTGLPLLLNGVSSYKTRPSPELVASISPLARLRKGEYTVPTFVIHSDADKIAPVRGAERFVDQLKLRGTLHGFLHMVEAPHLHDLGVECGDAKWEEVGPGYEFLLKMVRHGD
ncbi:conidial yellow pigment biosynthesis polyketide synthase [Triangularia verruculosa]|uniref:Conidial yellow pigment biosynthesis polyketide synthase n=1 Tax=Triangularia verruculosa TaxID=2587418 RepID=A0AAN6XMS2_9PEZI|nr:conidial yellow pigment biosynthesis polyketide synthase [Triangularia verruculosa]